MKKYILLLYVSLLTGTGFAQLNLQWQNMGPNNLGGTITALIIDNRDTTGQTLYAGAMGGGMWKSTDGATNWNYLGCIGNYAVNCMTQTTGGTIYIGTGFPVNYYPGTLPYNVHLANGIYYLDSADNFGHLDATTVTGPFSGWSSVNGIAVNPVNPNQIIATTNDSIFKSTDKGNTWSRVNITGVMTGNGVRDVKWSSNGLNIYISLIYGQLVRSVDGGNSWNIVNTATNPGFPNTNGNDNRIVLVDGYPDMAFISMEHSGNFWGVLKTDNAGNTWDTVMLANTAFHPSYSYFNTLAISPADTNHIYVGGDSLYSWSPQTGVSKLPQFIYPGNGATGPVYQYNLAVNSHNPNEMYVASEQGVFKTTQAYTDFTNAHFNPANAGLTARDFFSVAVSKSGRPMGSSNDLGALLIGNPGSSDYTPIGSEFGYCVFSYIDTTFAYTVSQQNYFNMIGVSIDGLATFGVSIDTNIAPGGFSNGYRCSTSNSSYLMLHETKNAFGTADSVAFVAASALTAGSAVTVPSNNAHTNFQYTLPVNLNTGDTLMVPDAVQSNLFYATNCGVWQKRHALLFNTPDWFNVSATRATCMAAGADGNKLYMATSFGEVVGISGLNFGHYNYYNMTDSFASVTTTVLAGRQINGIAVDPANDSIILVAMGGNTYVGLPNVYKSTDGGNTWEGYYLGANSLNTYTCIIDANNSSNYIVGTEHGIYTSADSGATWQPDNGDMCDVPVYQLQQTPLFTDQCSVLYAATSARGIWRSYTLTPAGCNVSLDLENPRNENGFDMQLYPNPATAVTHVTFTLPQPQPVTVRVFDITGRILQTLQQNLPTGQQNIELNTSALQAGTYLVIVAAQGAASTRLLVIGE